MNYLKIYKEKEEKIQKKKSIFEVTQGNPPIMRTSVIRIFG